MPKISEERLKEQFNALLKDKEIILWTGKPVRGIKLRDADIIILPMSIILLGFSGMLDYVLFKLQAPVIFRVIGFLFGLIAIYMGVIRILLNSTKREKTFYCITTKRVLMLSGSKMKLQTLPLKNIERIDLTEEKDGTGFIIFGNTNPLWPWLLGSFYMSGDNIPGLQMLPDVKKVFDLLQDELKVQMPISLREQITGKNKEDLN